nr:EAL domain-containing protein [uncultured Cohaesibacter sp.]
MNKHTFSLLRLFIPVIAMLAFLLAAASSLFWITRSIDLEASNRQKDVAQHAISQLSSSIAHNQESSTFWDDAVIKMTEPDNEEWIDENLGSWMHTFFGMDKLFVLNGSDQPIYAFDHAKISPREAYFEYAQIIDPFVKSMRSAIASGETPAENSGLQSIGVTDYNFINSRPALISIKPIISDSGEIDLASEQTYLHVAIQFLDGTFAKKLSHDYALPGLRVVSSAQRLPGDIAISVQSKSGGNTIEFEWSAYRPGIQLVKSIAPFIIVSAVMLLLGSLLVSWFSYRRKVDQIENECRVRYLSTHDSLTALPNRYAFDEAVEALCDEIRQQPASKQTAIMFLDLDRFKQINDVFGHQSGDQVLVEITRRLQTLLPAEATLFRLGGNGFTILLRGCSDDEVNHLSNQIISSVAAPIDLREGQVFTGISIGVSFAPLHGTDHHDLVRKADVALFHAKAAGRGHCSVFGDYMDEALQHQSRIEAGLRFAIVDKAQFSIHYQPKFTCGGTHLNSVEALIRWKHPEYGPISPKIFIPIAESNGLIGELGLWVLETACCDALHWQLDHVAINVSPLQLTDSLFALKVKAILGRTGFPASKLELELTETSIGGKSDVLLSNLVDLAAVGVTFAIDDFGTGSSSFERLKDVKFNRIKIDQGFIREITKSRNDTEIVRAMIALAHANGLQSTAEGVETEEQLSLLCSLGCDELQGYLLGKPKSREKIDHILLNNSGVDPHIRTRMMASA